MTADAWDNWEWITARRAEVLRELADGATEAEVASRLGLSERGAHRHVERLRAELGCHSGRELGRWWRANRMEWLAFMQRCAGE